MAQVHGLDNISGTARLPVVAVAAMVSFAYNSILEYALPLYFGALDEVARAQGGSYPADMWSEFWKYQIVPYIVGPILAGLLARRYGERIVWSGAQLGMAVIPVLLAIDPQPIMVKLVALWLGLTGAVMWIGGMSLVQMVPAGKKGFSNGLMMASIGVGCILGPLAARAILYRQEWMSLVAEGHWSTPLLQLVSLAPTITRPTVADFQPVFWFLAISTLLCGVMVGLWGQRPGRFEHDLPPDWGQTLSDLRHLASKPKFWALALTLCVLGGTVFQASNQFLPYRAEELGIKSGAADHGWLWLQLMKTVILVPGGLAVGLLAGRRAPGVAVVAMLGGFALVSLGVGESRLAWQLFLCVALFEFVRQFMRWAQAVYLSEHVPEGLRATAIGCSSSFAGLGATLFGWIANYVWNPNTAGFHSSQPFLAATGLCAIGCVGLYMFDRFCPIREPRAAIATAEPLSLISANATASDTSELNSLKLEITDQ